jgi:hypothetical protein
MNWLSHFFPRAKHWQMFLLLFGLCSVGQFVGAIAIAVTAPTSGELGRTALVELWLLTAVSNLVFLSWLWFMGSFLCSVVRPELRPRLAFFRVAIIYPLVVGFAESALIVPPKPWLLGVLFPLGLFAFVCIVYDFNFVAKALALAEIGKPRVVADFAGTLFLLVFFPLGVWFIQPRVNRLYSSKQKLVLPSK